MGNNTNESSEQLQTFIIWSVVFLVVGILIVVVNVVTIVIFVLHRNLRRRAVYCLINLAVADMLYGISTISLEVIYLSKLDIIVSIRIFIFEVLAITLLSSLISLTFVSLDRVCATFFPFRHRSIKLRTYVIIFVTIWLTSILQTMAMFYFTNEISLPSYAAYFAMFLLCLVVICVSYTAIFVHVKTQAQRVREQQQGPTTQMRQKRQQHLAMTLFIVTISSLITWAPYLSALFMTSFFRIEISYNALLLLVIIQRMNSLINPLVYVFRMQDFRKALVRMIFRCSHQRQRRIHDIGNHARRHLSPTLELEHVQ